MTDLDALDKLREAATPLDDKIELTRYEHGGGRFMRYGPDTVDRSLIADFYNEGDREWVVALVNAYPALAAELRALRGLANDVADEHEGCQQAANHRANPQRSGPCYQCAALAEWRALVEGK